MLPPADAFGHQARKAAEIIITQAQRSRSSAARRPPPPPYSSASGNPPSRQINKAPRLGRGLDYDYDEDEDLGSDDDVDDDGRTGARFDTGPIIIKIDASISIIGDRNTIAIPPVPSDRNNLNGPDDCRSPPPPPQSHSTEQQPASQQIGQCQPANSGARQATMQLQRFQRQRHSQYAELANTIVSALLLTDKGNEGNAAPPRRLEVDLDGGIRIRGTGNVVCAGALPRATTAAATRTTTNPSSSSPVGKNPTSPAEKTVVGMKRRNSDPLPSPSAKLLKTT